MTDQIAPTTSTPEAPTVASNEPAPFSLQWYDALIQQKQAQAQEMYAQYNQTLGVIETLVQMRQLAVQKEATDGSSRD